MTDLKEVCSLISLFWDFPFIFLLIMSNLMSLWSESRHCMISTLLNLLRGVLWSIMWPVLVNVSYKFDKNLYSAVIVV